MYYLQTRSLNTDTPVYQKLDGGPTSFLFPEARVARDYAASGLYEQSIIDWACSSLMTPGTDVIDIGAHCGIYTTAFARTSHVHAFECSPKSFNYLCANIALQGCDYAVTKHNVALGPTSGTTPYYIRDPKDGGGNGTSKFSYDDTKNTPHIDVPVRTLDSFGLTNIGLIKIDVEGSEQAVLEGAIETLTRNHFPKLLFESWRPEQESLGFPARALRESLFAFLQSLQYRIVPVRGWDDMFVAER
jgi:FkbM family methyltransferase